jgi:hypothetical protein
MDASLRSRVGIAAVAALFAIPLPESDPIGVYAIVDRVVVEPDTIAPERIQVWGTFVIQTHPASYQRSRGYLYYAPDPENRQATLAEWSDLRTLAGGRGIIGFGYWRGPNGRVRAESDRVAEPDVYPLGTGIYRNISESSAIMKWLRELHSAPRVQATPPPDGARSR